MASTSALTTSKYWIFIAAPVLVSFLFSVDLLSVTQLDMLGPNLRSIAQGENGAGLASVSSLDYDNLLRLAGTTNGGVSSEYVYDDSNRQYLTINFWSDPNGVLPDHAIANETVYDANDQAIGSRRYSIAGAQSTSDVLSQIDAATPLWETSVAYNLAGQLYRSDNRFGTATYTLYDVRGNAVETRTATNDPDTIRNGLAWVVARTRYDANGRVVAVSSPEVVLNPLAPDQGGFDLANDQPIEPSTGVALSVGDAAARARVTHTLYDPLGRVVQTRLVEGVPIATTLVFTASSPEDSLFDTDFNASYDDALHVVSRSTSDYDDQGLVFRTTSYAEFDQPGTETRVYVKYDDAGRQTAVAQAYDDNGSGVIDVNELADGSLDFDAPGAEAFISTTLYDQAGRQESTTDAKNVTTQYGYDDLGRLLSTTIDPVGVNPTGLNIVIRDSYDYTGRRVTSTDALGQVTSYRYDQATGRLLGVTLPTITDDSTGAITGAPDYEYGYDDYGSQTTITDPNDHTLDFAFDQFGRQTSRTTPEGLSETREHNDLGQVVRSVDFEGSTTDYFYDNFGRLDEKRFFDVGVGNAPDAGAGQASNHTELVDYVYDAFGRVTQIGQDRDLLTPGYERTTTHSYDQEGRLERVATDEGVIRYEFDDLGRLITTLTGEDAASANTVTRYEYDPLGRLSSVISEKLGGVSVAPADQATDYRYDAVGNLEYVLGPDHASFYVYDNANRLRELTQFVDSPTSGVAGQYDSGVDRLIATFEYEVRADGRRSDAVETFYQPNGSTILVENTFAWTYDPAGRLVEETLTSTDSTGGADALTGYTDTYGFDLTGNRLEYQHDSDNNADDKTVTYQYDQNDRLLVERSYSDLTATTLDTTTLYEYGANADALAGDGGGSDRQTRKTLYTGDPAAGGVIDTDTTYGYNAQGRLDSVTIDDGVSPTTTTYEYSDDGIRVAQQVDAAAKELFLVDNQNPTGFAQVLEHRAATLSVLRAYLLGHDVLAQQDAASGIVHFLYDGHGSTRGLVDATGQLLDGAVYAYDAYGVRIDASTAKTSLLYSGEWRDANGFDYLRARPYDFKTGRFMRLDDFVGYNQDPQTLHKYLYTNGDPINGLDPNGYTNLVEVNVVSGQQSSNRVQSANNGVRTSGATGRTLVAIALLEMQRLAATIDELEDFQLPMALYNGYLAARFAKAYKGKDGDAKLGTKIPKLTSYMAAMGVSADRIRGVDSALDIGTLKFPFLSNGNKGRIEATTWIPMTGRYVYDRRLSIASALKFSSVNVAVAVNSGGDWAQAASDATKSFIASLKSSGISFTGVQDDWVWHHNEILGIMELTSRDAHKSNHTGGVFFYEILTNSKYKA